MEMVVLCFLFRTQTLSYTSCNMNQGKQLHALLTIGLNTFEPKCRNNSYLFNLLGGEKSFCTFESSILFLVSHFKNDIGIKTMRIVIIY